MWKKRGKRAAATLLAIVAIVMAAFYQGGTAEASESGANINSAREGVSVVEIWLEERKTGKSTLFSCGTGFFVGKEGENPQYLVTNEHVVHNFLELGAGEWSQIYSLNPETGEVEWAVEGKLKIRVRFSERSYKEGYVVDSDETKDIALLKLDKPTKKRKALPLCIPDDNMVGMSVWAIGYPGISDSDEIDAVSNSDVSDSSVTKGIISRLTTTAGTGVRKIQTDTSIASGNSGGPLVNENGEVLGINSETLKTFTVEDRELLPDVHLSDIYVDAENYYAVNIEEMIDMLKDHNVEFALAGEGTDSVDADENADADKNTDVGANADVDANADVSADADTDGKENNMALVIGIVAAVIVVLLIIIVALLLSRKKKGTQPTAANQPYANGGGVSHAGAAVNPVVRSLSSQHGGSTFPLNGKQILIGRNVASCTVIFREGTPGVSSRHCSLEYDKARGEFVLIDLKSTYGTFLANGQQLSPGIPYYLRSGDQFYLGGNENMLRVEA